MPPALATAAAARPPLTTLRRDNRADTTSAKLTFSEWLETKSSSTLAMAGVLVLRFATECAGPGGRAGRDVTLEERCCRSIKER